MASENESSAASGIVKMILYGIVTLALYIALFKYEETLLSFAARGKWAFILPITIAFVFSFFHGSFTSLFWDTLGVKAKK